MAALYPSQWRLTDLFVITAFLAVLAGPASQMHPGLPPYLFIAGCLLSYWLLYIIGTEGAWRSLRWIGTVLMLLLGISAFVPLFVFNLLVHGVASYFFDTHQSRRQSLYLSMACTLIAIAITVLINLPMLMRIHSARQELPFVSLAPRLSYEVDRVAQLPKTVDLSPKVTQELAILEEHFTQRSYRQEALKRLHEQNAVYFIIAEGNGISRMPVRTSYVSAIELEDVHVDDRQMKNYVRYGFYDNEISNDHQTPLQTIHDVSQGNFLSGSLWGYVRSFQESAGFHSHAFTHSPNVDHWNIKHEIIRLELVSLLKHPTPKVYVSDQLPRMDKLSSQNAPVRDLTVFEQSALPRLLTQEDIVTDVTPDRVLMLGSLRAGESCRQCHAVPVGTLLGAFSYELK
jgi:hypothetical protein